MKLRPFLLCALSLTLASCGLMPKREAIFVPPKVDCAAYDAPKVEAPTQPTSKALPEWQLYAYGWETYALGVLGQRVDTAQCLATLRASGVIK